jgi:hypothetical protein
MAGVVTVALPLPLSEKPLRLALVDVVSLPLRIAAGAALCETEAAAGEMLVG